MQAKRPLLPEFYALRHDPEARPVGGARHCTPSEAVSKHFYPTFEVVAALQGTRLVRRPGADLAVARPGCEICVGFVVADRFDCAFYPNLPV